MRTVNARARKSVYMRYINIYVEEVLSRVELPFADYQLRGNEHVGSIPVDTGVPPAVQIRFYRILFPREGESKDRSCINYPDSCVTQNRPNHMTTISFDVREIFQELIGYKIEKFSNLYKERTILLKYLNFRILDRYRSENNLIGPLK